MKSSALRIRVEPELHRNFLDMCKRLDIPAAQLLRQYMRKFVEENKNDMQDDLFDDDNTPGNSSEGRGKR